MCRKGCHVTKCCARWRNWLARRKCSTGACSATEQCACFSLTWKWNARANIKHILYESNNFFLAVNTKYCLRPFLIYFSILKVKWSFYEKCVYWSIWVFYALRIGLEYAMFQDNKPKLITNSGFHFKTDFFLTSRAPPTPTFFFFIYMPENITVKVVNSTCIRVVRGHLYIIKASANGISISISKFSLWTNIISCLTSSCACS